MIGNTNALSVTTTSGGGGNKIYVENCMSLPVEAGRQVLLNMTLTDEDLELFYYSSWTPFYGLVLDNEIFTCGNDIRRYQAGSVQTDVIGWVEFYCDNHVYFYMNPNTGKLQTIELNSSNVYEVSAAGSRKVGYFYLGDGLCIYEGKVYHCNVMEGKLEDEVYNLPIGFEIRNNFQGYAYIDKNLFVTNTTSIYQIDFSDLNDIKVVRSATGLGPVNYFHGFTGPDVGDYVLGRAGGSLVMYRLSETGFTLIEDNDLSRPSCLCGVSLGSVGNSLLYNPMTGILTFLQSNLRFKAFSFNHETKNFTEIVLPEKVAKISSYNNSAWGLLSISPDGNLMTKCYQNPSSQTVMTVYVNSCFDGKLKAYDSDSYFYRSNSLTGFLTGNVDEEGRVEVEVIVPEVVNLSVEVLPEPNVFEIKGDVL